MRARRLVIFILISFFLESCRERYSPYSFVAFSTAFTNPEVEFFIQVWTRPLNFVCIFFFPKIQADAMGVSSVSQVLWSRTQPEQSVFTFLVLKYFAPNDSCKRVNGCIKSGQTWSIPDAPTPVRGLWLWQALWPPWAGCYNEGAVWK